MWPLLPFPGPLCPPHPRVTHPSLSPAGLPCPGFQALSSLHPTQLINQTTSRVGTTVAANVLIRQPGHDTLGMTASHGDPALRGWSPGSTSQHRASGHQSDTWTQRYLPASTGKLPSVLPEGRGRPCAVRGWGRRLRGQQQGQRKMPSLGG